VPVLLLPNSLLDSVEDVVEDANSMLFSVAVASVVLLVAVVVVLGVVVVLIVVVAGLLVVLCGLLAVVVDVADVVGTGV